jgi:hypothetical protein
MNTMIISPIEPVSIGIIGDNRSYISIQPAGFDGVNYRLQITTIARN